MPTDRQRTLERTLAQLSDNNAPLTYSSLIELSNISREELTTFARTWEKINEKRRMQVITRLVELAEENVELNFDNIFKHALKDGVAEVRSKAIEGLWENEETPLINTLIGLLERDRAEEVQIAAASALGKFAMLTAENRLRPEYETKIAAALLGVVRDDKRSIEVRRRALEAVAPLNLPEVKKAILDAYQAQDCKLKISAIYALGKHCDISQLPLLIKETESTDAEARYEAAGACGEIGEQEAVPCLIRLSGDNDTDVQQAAITALGRIGGRQAKEHLKRCQKSNIEAVSQAAEQALQQLEAEEEPLGFQMRAEKQHEHNNRQES